MKIPSQLIILMLSFLSFAVFAKEINLLEQPKPDAKVVEKIDLANGIIPIYTPKNQKGDQWVKIADPRNGNTGWVKSADLNSTGSFQSTVTFSEGTLGDKMPGHYQIIQFGQPNNLTEAQTQVMMRNMQIKRQKMEDMMRNMDYLFYNDRFMK